MDVLLQLSPATPTLRLPKGCLCALLQPPLTAAPRSRELSSLALPATTTAAAAAAAAAAADRSPGAKSSGAESPVTSLNAPLQPKRGRPRKKPKLLMFALLRERWRARCLARSRGKECPSPITFPAKTNEEKLPDEDFIRKTELIITRTHAGGITKDEPLIIAKTMYDYCFQESPEDVPFILVNFSLLRGVQLDGFFERYPNPEDPPYCLRTANGTKMKAYGQFYAKLGPSGVASEYANQQIFLNPLKYMDVLCVAVEETCIFEVLVGRRSIFEHALNRPFETTVAPIGGHDGKPRIDHDARNKKKPALDAKKRDLASIQDAREEKTRAESKQARKSKSAKKQ